MPWRTPELGLLPIARDGDDYRTLHRALVIVSRDWLITRWNQTATRLLGISPDEALGRQLWDVLPELVGEPEQVFREAAESRCERTMLLVLRCGGSARPVEVLPIPGGEIVIEIDACDALVEAAPNRIDDVTARLMVGQMMSQRRDSAVEAGPPAGSQETLGGNGVKKPELPSAERQAESGALAQVARALTGADADPAESLHILCTHTMQLLAAEGAAIAMIAGAELRAEAVVGCLAGFDEASTPIAGTLAVETLRRRAAVYSNDVAADHRLRTDSAAAFGARNIVMTPMIIEDKPVGLLLAVNSRGGFTQADASLLERLADQGSLALRSALLFRQAQRRAREARALAEIVRNINQSLEVDRVFELIASQATALLDARESRLAMIDDADLIVVAGHAMQPLTGWRMSRLDCGCDAFPGVRRPVRGLARDDVNGVWRWPAGAANAPVISVPLTIADRALGALRVLGADGQVFDQHDEELLIALAEHASIAIENARLYHASVRTLRHASILAASARSLALHVDPAAMYADVWRLARTSLDADGIGIYLVEQIQGAVDLTFTAGTGADAASASVPRFWQTFGAEVVATGRPRFVPTIAPGDPGPPADALEDVGATSVALLPLIVEGKPRGMLSLRFRTRQSFELEQQHFLMDFASHAAAAVRNALLIHDLEEQAAQLRSVLEAERREREEAEAAAAIARVALRCHDIRAACAQILASIDAVIPGTASALALRRDDGAIRYVAARGEAEALLDTAVTIEEQGRDTPRVHVAPCVDDTVLPLSSGDALIGVLALAPPPRALQAEQRRASLARLAPPLSLALSALLLREEERRVAEQLRQSERLAALGELVAGVAHEVNNPLTGISAFAQLLQDEPLTQDQLESVRLIKKEADRAVAVIRDLLTFARKTGPRLVAVDLNELIEQTLRLRTYGLRTMGIEVQLDLSATLWRVRGDDRQLQQVVLNLVVNAEHAMTGRPTRVLRIRTRNEETHAVLEVHDTGCGMSGEVQRRIFEPFFTTKPDGRGTGLGLSVSYGIVRNLQGQIEVESTPGVGSCFRVILPGAHDSNSPEPTR